MYEITIGTLITLDGKALCIGSSIILWSAVAIGAYSYKNRDSQGDENKRKESLSPLSKLVK